MLDEIRSDLDIMSETVATARNGLARDEFVDIGDIGQRVQEVAAKVGELGPEDAIEIKPHLTGLLEEFKSFSEEVRAKIAALAEANGQPSAAGDNGAS
jgi:hypothetical protein